MGSKKKRNRGKGSAKAAARRHNSPLSAHKQEGKTLRSPFNSIPNLQLHSWLRDGFPDYLWPCFHFSCDLDRGTRIVVATLDRVNACLDRELGNKASDRTVLDGSLTSWEEVPECARAAVIDDLRQAGSYETAVPEDFAHMLGMYPSAPGAWLIGGWRQAGLSIDPDAAERALNETIRNAFHGRNPVATRAKAMAFRGLLVADKLRFAAEFDVLEMLPRYPHELDADEIAHVESFIRASFGTSRLRGDGETDPADEWAAGFWRANWQIYPCRLADDEHTEPSDEEIRAALGEFSDAVNRMWADFEDVAIKADPDLFNPDRYEVLTGIAARSLRILTAGVRSPTSWTTEHSAPLVRSMAEAVITISWLAHRDDEAMYTRFKDFGRGRLKLLKLHLEQYADSFDEVPEDIGEQLARLDALVNEDLSEEFQDIDLSGSFSGLDLRKMAYEVALEREYRLVLAPSSSDFHGEWGHMARYALTWCANPAHRFHRVPREDIQPDLSPGVVRTAIGLARRVIDAYVAAITGSREPGEP